MQSIFDNQRNASHVAIIMDGNGRWARAQGLPRHAGHRAGIDTLRQIVRAAPDQGIATLTVYAFSTANWQRPQAEVNALMRLFSEYLDTETEDLVRDGVRLSIIGRRDRLSPELVAEIERSEAATQFGDALQSARRHRLFRPRGDPRRRPRIARPRTPPKTTSPASSRAKPAMSTC